MARHRLNLSIPEALFRRLLKMNQTCGFRSVCKLSVSILAMAAEYHDNNRRHAVAPCPDTEEIASMFAALESCQRQPDGVAPQYRRKRKEVI